MSRGRSVATGDPHDVLVRERLTEVWEVDAALRRRDDGATALEVAWL